jgi:hypothetical protein
MSVEAFLSLRINGRYRRTLGGSEIAAYAFDEELRLDLRGGAGSNEAELLWAATRSIAGSANDDLDLNGGGLLDPFGQAVNFVELRFVYIKAAETNAGNVRAGGSASNRLAGLFAASTDYVDLRPGAAFFATFPIDGDLPVIAGTGDILRITNLGTLANTYDAILIGTSS